MKPAPDSPVRRIPGQKDRRKMDNTIRKNGDYVIRATAAGGFIRAFAVTARGTAEEARRRHGLSPVATAALGRVMDAALMMGYDLKNENDLLTLQFACDGPIGGITVTADAHGTVKGYVEEPMVLLPPNAEGKLDVGGAVGHGEVRVIKDIGLKEPYNGMVEIRTGEIGDDIAYYFAASEQIPSVVALGVLVDTGDYHVRESGGMLIQLMPDCPEDVISALEERCAALPQVTALLREGKTPEDLLEMVLGGMDLQINDKKAVRFACSCSMERIEKVVIALGRKEIEKLIAEGEDVTLTCSFCGNSYTVPLTRLRELGEGN